MVWIEVVVLYTIIIAIHAQKLNDIMTDLLIEYWVVGLGDGAG